MSAPELSVERLQALVVEQRNKIWHLQEKFLALQQALVAANGLQLVPAGGPLAEVAPVELSRSEGAETTVIVFAGLNLRSGIPQKEFARSLSDRNVNILFVKDFFQSWYLRGLLGVSADIDGTADFLRGAVPEGTRRIRCLGVSSGAFGAIHVGLRLGADRILAFSPQTLIRPVEFDLFGSFDTYQHRIDFTSPDVDLVKVMERFPDHAGRLQIYYSAGYVHDVNYARRLAAFPSVELHPVDHDTHAAVTHLAGTGELEPILDAFCA